MEKMVFIVMGVSGSGKSSLAQALANDIGGKYYDGDDFHPVDNINKMSSGIPLTDQDRYLWLHSIKKLAVDSYKDHQYTYIACSALKEHYRAIIKEANVPITFLFLKGEREIILQRLKERANEGEHFMPTSLLDSQFTSLEIPKNADDIITLDIELSIPQLIKQVKEKIIKQ